ncbi:MAG: hypothetical protein IJ192_02530 [Clostridia bacterium]|nr:hypothetical protein [Clostridia bacterium]
MLIGLLEEENELHGELEFGAGTSPPIIMGGYHLNTVDIRTLTISDLINTSKSKYYIAGDEAFVVCSAEGGTGSYTYEVYVEGDGYADGGEEIAVSNGYTLQEGNNPPLITEDDLVAKVKLHSGIYKIRVIVTDSVGVKSTQYFLIDHY